MVRTDGLGRVPFGFMTVRVNGQGPGEVQTYIDQTAVIRQA